MEKKFKLFLIIALSLMLGQGAFTLAWMASGERTAYINTEEVYNGFPMKIRLEAELKKTQQARQHLLDSMRLQLDLMSMKLEQNKEDATLLASFSNLEEIYLRREEEIEQANQALAKRYSDQIWTQLNQYMKDYGNQEDYNYIFGASGDGTLMFANDAVNITEDVKAYVNERFNGQP